MPLKMRDIWLPSVIVAILGVSVIEWQVAKEKQETIQLEHDRLEDHLSLVRMRIERSINNTLYLGRGLNTYIISQGGNLEKQRLQQWLAAMHASTDNLINIGVAPGNRIEVIYPVQGNEAALGVYYPDLPQQWQTIQALIETGASKLTGPIDLIQGGQGFIYRSPLSLNGQYWGITSMVIDTQGIADILTDQQLHPGTHAVLLDETGTPLIGRIVSADMSEEYPLQIPGADWHVQGVRSIAQDNFISLRLMSYGLLLLAGILLARINLARWRTDQRDHQRQLEHDRRQNQFVSVISHELRTPLTSLQGALSMLALAINKPSSQVLQLLDIGERNAKQLNMLINNLMDLDRLSRDELVVNLQSTPLSPLTRYLAVVGENKGKAHNITVHHSLPKQEVQALTDPDRLEQVVYQLLDNAIKFSPKHSTVTLAMSRRGNRAQLVIADQGPGMASQAAMFKRFTQADSSASRHSEGTGIGLALVSELCAAMNIDIEVNTGPQGTQITLQLPCQPEV